MELSDLPELHFITDIANVPSILQDGILCHKRAEELDHVSIADPTVQAIRDRTQVPRGFKLHEYANLYICARNPMLFKRKDKHPSLTVLRVSTDVLHLRNVVIADGNAASGRTAFWASPEGLKKIEKNIVFAKYWTDQNRVADDTKKTIKCAEVLISERVEPRYIIGAYVSRRKTRQKLIDLGFSLPIEINSYLFFAGRFGRSKYG